MDPFTAEVLYGMLVQLPPGGGKCDVGDLQAAMMSAQLDFHSEAVQAFGGMCQTSPDGVVDYSKFLQCVAELQGESVAPAAMMSAPDARIAPAPHRGVAATLEAKRMGLAAGPQGLAIAPVPSAAALRAVGGSKQRVAGAPSQSRRGMDRQGIKVVGDARRDSSNSISNVCFGVDYTVGCERPARGVHQRSGEIWEVFHAWEGGDISAQAMVRMLQNMGLNVSSKTQGIIQTDSQLNFQQLLFMLNEAAYKENVPMGVDSAPGVDIKGVRKPSHKNQVALGAFQRQRNEDFVTHCSVPNFKPSKSNIPSASNPMVADHRIRHIEAQREPQDNREKAQELVRRYTDGALKTDVFTKEICALGIDARPDSEIARLAARLDAGDERVGFRAFNMAIAKQYV